MYRLAKAPNEPTPERADFKAASGLFPDSTSFRISAPWSRASFNDVAGKVPMVARASGLPVLVGSRKRKDQLFAPPFVILNTRPGQRRSTYSVRATRGGFTVFTNLSVSIRCMT